MFTHSTKNWAPIRASLHNAPTAPSKFEAYLYVGVPVSTALKQDPSQVVISSDANPAQAINYFKPHPRLSKIKVVVSTDHIIDTIKDLQDSHLLNEVTCHETGELFDLSVPLKLSVQLLKFCSSKRDFKALGQLLSSQMGLVISQKQAQLLMQKHGLSSKQIKEVMHTKAYQDHLNQLESSFILPQKDNIRNILSLSDIQNSSFYGVNILKAPTGAGKNQEVAIPQIKKALASNGKVVFLSHLKAIIHMTIQDLAEHGVEMVSYEDRNVLFESPAATGICTQSLHHDVLMEVIMDADLVVIDEIEAVVRRMLIPSPKDSEQGLTPRARQNLFERLRHILTHSKNLLLMDADFSSLTLSMLESLRDDVYVYDMEQDYSHISASVALREVVEYQASLDIRGGANTAVLFDTKSELNAFLTNLGYDEESALQSGILVIHSENVGRPEQEGFLNNTDAVLQSGHYRAILSSPSLGRGYSITHDFCKRVYVIASGVLDPANLIQFPRRFRKATEFVFGTTSKLNPVVDYTADAAGNDFAMWQAKYRTENEHLMRCNSVMLKHALKLRRFNAIPNEYECADNAFIHKVIGFAQKARTDYRELHQYRVLNALNITQAVAEERKHRNDLTLGHRDELARNKIQTKTGVNDIGRKEYAFDKQFDSCVQKSLFESGSPLNYLLKSCFHIEDDGSKRLMLNGELCIDLISHLQSTPGLLNKVNSTLPKPLQIASTTPSPTKAMNVLKKIFVAGGFVIEGNSRREIKGKRSNVYYYKLGDYTASLGVNMGNIL